MSCNGRFRVAIFFKLSYNCYNYIRRNHMKAVVSVIGKDMTGILARVSQECAQQNANVLEVSQTLLQDMFAMIMLIDIEHLHMPLSDFAAHMERVGKDSGLVIHVMHEDIFHAMHKI